MNKCGYLIAQCGKYDKAFILCERVCQIERNVNYLGSLGFIYLKAGRVNESIALFWESLTLWPGHQESIEHPATMEDLVRGVHQGLKI